MLCGRGDDQLKGAALDALVALGGAAEPDLTVTLDDPVGGEWARAALEQLGSSASIPAPSRSRATRRRPRTKDRRPRKTARATPPSRRPPQARSGPDQGLVDDAYDDFLRRYGQEQGEEPSSP